MQNMMMMGTTMGTGVQLELLPMEFNEIDEARRVNDIQAKASWRAKEKSRARKKAKLENNNGSNNTMSSNSASGGSSLDGKEGSMNVDVSLICISVAFCSCDKVL